MDLTLLRKVLNLGDDVSDADVMAKASTFVQEQATKAQGATGQLEAVTAQLSAHGLALSDGKVVKLARVELSTEPVEGDDPEKAAMRAALAKANAATGKDQVNAVKTTVEAAIKDGRIPKALQDPFTKLASIGADAPRLALSTDGKLVVEKFSEALECVKTIFKGLPPMTGDQLSQLSAVKPEDDKGGTTGDADDKDRKMKPEELSAIAARAMPKGERTALEARKK